ncbi:hypothetical protein DEO72_LG10g2096 [Vigna unguiculata]|uniref:Uncharacterized protein n=1 Tax=Vigna unguiculata TaxID=3917 RepID=A0A4D6NDN8_VIGUN|nr:hypothetical protein DEO72_LG10g2096 [Vigna unguiculata]
MHPLVDLEGIILCFHRHVLFERDNRLCCRSHGLVRKEEIKEGGQAKVEELQEELKVQAAKHAEEKAAWEKEREEWLAGRKRLGS